MGGREFGSVVADVQKVLVLLLGNFKEPHYRNLLQLSAGFNAHGYHPVLFDFEKSPSSDFGETIRLLAGFAAFIVADLTDPRSVLMEVQLIAPDLATPIVPIMRRYQEPVALFADLLGKYDWVINTVSYDDIDELLSRLTTDIIEVAASKRAKIDERRAQPAAALIVPKPR
ncbi:MAG: hypothetical protein K0V04_36415 [Deltaproteobacteria bacterium]|nr:hypothetical protein [Deltaproteobacteria bacterium]